MYHDIPRVCFMTFIANNKLSQKILEKMINLLRKKLSATKITLLQRCFITKQFQSHRFNKKYISNFAAIAGNISNLQTESQPKCTMFNYCIICRSSRKMYLIVCQIVSCTMFVSSCFMYHACIMFNVPLREPLFHVSSIQARQPLTPV